MDAEEIYPADGAGESAAGGVVVAAEIDDGVRESHNTRRGVRCTVKFRISCECYRI